MSLLNRVNLILIACGFKGGGKTYQTLKIIAAYISSASGRQARKVVLFDTNEEYTNEMVKKSGFNFTIKTIKVAHLQNFIRQQKIECVRILARNADGSLMKIAEKKQTAWRIINEFRGGLVVLDDMNNYVLNVTQEEELVSAIMNNAHRNADIIINFQSINMINPILIRNMNLVRMHYETDEPDQGKFKGKWELYLIAQKIIHKKYSEGNQKYCLTVDNLQSKIKGAFTKADFAIACKRYVTQHNPKLIRQELTQFGSTDKQKRYEAATVEAVKKLFMYWGNG